ncbi:MAG TPA: hypothetical protein PKM65_08255 [Spirochaetota bacterium]|nr:hypothetical protein [Spirochaetota bacterium]HNT09645.1 hypothetical protein [Spirochaetota bacterium]HNV45658.1 hypothetical protein [Spirochaetota bacterium]HOS39035.1 hypothetical protein [Spirochaetota bacterium]HPI21863.1 hypothetical protein [Spirochaetota bacterium]
MKKSLTLLFLLIFSAQLVAIADAGMSVSAKKKNSSKHSLVKKQSKKGKGTMSRGWKKTKKRGR